MTSSPPSRSQLPRGMHGSKLCLTPQALSASAPLPPTGLAGLPMMQSLVHGRVQST